RINGSDWHTRPGAADARPHFAGRRDARDPFSIVGTAAGGGAAPPCARGIFRAATSGGEAATGNRRPAGVRSCRRGPTARAVSGGAAIRANRRTTPCHRGSARGSHRTAADEPAAPGRCRRGENFGGARGDAALRGGGFPGGADGADASSRRAAFSDV